MPLGTEVGFSQGDIALDGDPAALLNKCSAVAEIGDRLVATDMGRKLGAVPLFFGGGGAGSPSNKMWRGPRPTSVPSGTLINPAIWPQQTRAKNSKGAVPLGGAGPHLPQCRLHPGLTSYQVAF